MSGTWEHKVLNDEASNFFRFNAQPVEYLEPQNLTFSRTGTVLSSDMLERCEVLAQWDINPTEETVTAFGSHHEYRVGTRATLRVLADDLMPELRGAFVINGIRYEVLSIQPEYRGHLLWRYQCLLGFE